MGGLVPIIGGLDWGSSGGDAPGGLSFECCIRSDRQV